MVIGSDFFLDLLCLAILGRDIDSKRVVRSVIDTYNEETAKGVTFDDGYKFCIDMSIELVEDKVDLDSPSDVEVFLMKFESYKGIKDNPKTIKRITTIIEERDGVGDYKKRQLQKKLRNWVIWVNGNTNLKKLFRKSQMAASESDPAMQDMIIDELASTARKLADSYVAEESDEVIDLIDMSCKKSIGNALKAYKYKRDKPGYKTGLQGLNKAFGHAGGPCDGEFGAFAAMSYHYKSGILMDLLRWAAMYNDPPKDIKKPPCLVFISLENEVYENMNQWAHNTYYNIHKKKVPSTMSDEELINHLHNVFNGKGYKIFVYKKEGETFGFNEYKALLDEISKKYTICGSILDYALLMSLDKTDSDNEVKQRQMLFYKLKTYANRNLMHTATGIQLDTEAKRLAAYVGTNVVQKMTDALIADCKAIKSELDYLFFMYIEFNHQKVKYLTFRMDKHKYVHNTPEEYKYFAYRLHEGIGLIDDINSLKCEAVYDIYAEGVELADNEVVEGTIPEGKPLVF